MISTVPGSSGAGLPQGGGARLVIFVAFLGLFLSGYNNFMLPLALIKLTPAFKLSAWQNGELLAATFLGMLLGGAIFGRLADVLGRKRAMIVNMLIIAACAIATGFVTGPEQLLTLRLIIGIGIGGGYPIGSSYVADIAQNHHRGSRMTLAFSGWGFGALAAGLIGWAMLTMLPANQGWRWMLASGAIPAIAALAIIAVLKMPESHAWKHASTLAPLSTRALFSPAHRRLTIAALLPWFLMDLPVYGIGLLTPTLLTELGIGKANMVVAATCGLAALTLAGFLTAFQLIDTLGRRRLQMTGFFGMAVLFTILALGVGHFNKWAILGLFAIIQIFINAGPNTTTWIVPAELFPTRLRATGQGSATAFSRIGAASGAFFLPVLNAHSGPAAAFLLVAAASALALWLTYVYLPETARTDLMH